MGWCERDTKTFPAEWHDPLGPNAAGKHAPTGGPEARSQIFDYLQGSLFPQSQQAANRAAGAMQEAAGSPALSGAVNSLSRTASGGYLSPSPQLTKAVGDSRNAMNTRLAATRGQSMADLEGQQAATRSGFARSGLGFSTANTQAQDATKAALAASLARGEQQAAADQAANESATFASNYQQERGLQNAAASAMPQTLSAKGQLLSAVPGVMMQPTTQAAEIVRGLASGGQSIQPTVMQQPSGMDYGIGMTSALMSGGW